MLNDKDPALNLTGVTVTDNSFSYGDYIYTQVMVGSFEGATTLDEAWEILNAELAAEGMTWDDLVALYIEYGIASSEEEVLVGMGLTEETFVPYAAAGYWSVSLNLEVTDKTKTSYGPILESINGIPVTTMQDTFRECDNLTVDGIPEIPSTVTTMRATFAGCDSLIKAPELPQYVVDIGYTFFECDALVTPPSVIPSTVVNMEETFLFCRNLATIPDMSKAVNVQDMRATFGSTLITVAPVIPSSVTNMKNTFSNCKNLKTYIGSTDADGDFSNFIIPAGVTDMGYTFYYCTGLTVAPTIPSNVNNTMHTFAYCSSITGEISIPCTLGDKSYSYLSCPATITYYHVDGCDGSCGK